MEQETEYLCDTISHVAEVRKNLEELVFALQHRGLFAYLYSEYRPLFYNGRWAGYPEIVSELNKRGIVHDISKFKEPEFIAFSSTRERFKKAQYGTDEYKQLCDEVRPALEHHYQNNRHHPEHHTNGVKDMTLVDVLEMLADWKAASVRPPYNELKDTLSFSFERNKIDGKPKELITDILSKLGWI